MYPGPDPLIAVTASCCRSGTLAGGGHQRLGLDEVRLVAVQTGGDRRHALVDQGRGVRHHPHDGGALGQPGLDERRGDAGGQGHHQLPGAYGGGDLVDHVAHVLRLHDQHQGVGAPDRLEVRDHLDAVPLLQLVGALAALLADQEVLGAPAGADQAGEQGLPHHPGPDDRDGHFLDTSECTKNDRLLGRSASRRIR
jgi:hypothetical protein